MGFCVNDVLPKFSYFIKFNIYFTIWMFSNSPIGYKHFEPV